MFLSPYINYLSRKNQYLNMSGLIILKKIADKQAFPLALHEMIVALSGACSSATCSTHSASFFAD
jgi:hypothetical protein